MKKIFLKSVIITRIYDKIREVYYKHLISDEENLKKQFRDKLGRDLNLKNPENFNEKLQWLKLNIYDSRATKYADKYEVREIIAKKIGEKYLNELIGVYNSVEEIDIDKLPNRFVLKGTHGSGYNIICRNKEDMDWKKEFRKMKRWMNNNYFWRKREWVYKNIKPRIICEKYLEDETGQLKDYKIMCFNGEPRIIQVMSERTDTGFFVNHFDLDWNKIDIPRKTIKENHKQIKKPECLEEMIEISKKLSENFPFVRIDLYEVDGQIYFGECTFFPVSGYMDFENEKDDELLGSWIELPYEK